MNEHHNWYFAGIFLGPIIAFGAFMAIGMGLEAVFNDGLQGTGIGTMYITLLGASLFIPSPIFMWLDMRHIEGMKEHLGYWKYPMLLFVWFGSVFLYYWERRKVTKATVSER